MHIGAESSGLLAHAEAPPHVRDHLLHRRRVLPVPLEHRVRERQPVHHGHPNEQLRGVRPAVPRIAALGQLARAEPLVVGAGEIEE